MLDCGYADIFAFIHDVRRAGLDAALLLSSGEYVLLDDGAVVASAYK